MTGWKPLLSRLDRIVCWISAQIGTSIGFALAWILIAAAVTAFLDSRGETLRICLGVCP